MDLGRKFKTLRTEKGFSVYKLAKISDVSENYIRTIEKGSSQPSVAVVEKLLLCLGTTIAEFFNESTDVIYPTEFERDLIESVRVLNEEKAAAILQMTKLLSE